jgi:hypothetical protein
MVVCALAALGLVMGTVNTAGAAQIGVKTAPNVSGPLIKAFGAPEKCSTVSPKRDGQVAAVAEQCLWGYNFDIGSESDASKDYGVAWMQTVITPKNGWCVAALQAALGTSNGAKIVSVTPGSTSVASDKRKTASLVVDPAGEEQAKGRISQSYLLEKGKLQVTNKADSQSGGRIVQTTWSGLSKDKVAIVTGMVLSWGTGDSFAAQVRNGGAYAIPPSKDMC